MDPSTLRQIGETGCGAARAGGSQILDLRDRFSVREKAPSDFVTEADLASQQAIRDVILQAFPDHRVLAEEDSDHSLECAPEDYLWVVDPLDGTTNFVHGIPHYAVSIACLHGATVVAGVVYDPVRDELFEATRQQGARRNGVSLRASDTSALADAMVGFGMPPQVTQDSPDLKTLLRLTPHCRAIRRLGAASLNLAYVAAGRLDGYWAAFLHPWDWLAGALLVEESRGLITSLQGQPIGVSTTSFVAAGSQTLHAELVRMIADT